MSELTPVDKQQCQAEKQGGSFMSFGIPPYIRCLRKPVWIASEKESGDGQLGSMSLCHQCRLVLEKEQLNRASFERIYS
ncbi:hypothetical protein LCGC14_0787760 [marine sediment metagenome]|uniref:Uncharacterized protein n=1 Tax=marine sediment metagenome TaxID=412755 RepID=A0A0F9QDC9_9ZZZZ